MLLLLPFLVAGMEGAMQIIRETFLAFFCFPNPLRPLCDIVTYYNVTIFLINLQVGFTFKGLYCINVCLEFDLKVSFKP